MLRILRRCGTRWLLAVGVLAGAAPAVAKPLDRIALATFFDRRVAAMLQQGDIAGGVVAVVQDGQVVFARGYGQATLAPQRPFTVDRTLLRPGSISKLFTWIAVHQLVEQHRLDLDRDVNAYLDFRIRPAFGRPVTLRDLMTHSGGFQEVSRDLFVTSPEKLYLLGEYLRRRQPARIYPPGEVIAYSNYGTALAGYIVQRVSGERYEDYVARHILAPLGMRHSTMRQPLPTALRPLMANGYATRSAGVAKPFELIEAAPAGALTTSAADMTRLMTALADGGRFGRSILGPAGFAAFEAPARTMAPGRNGFTLGMFENDRNGLRIIGHDGDTLWFHSDLQIVPAERLALFVSLNSAGNGLDVRRELFRGFLDTFYPYRTPALPIAPTARADAQRVAGWYETSRRHQTVLGLKRTFYQFRVTARPDGTLEIPIWGDADKHKLWREIGPLEYQEVGGQARLSFVPGGDGAICHFVSDDDTPIQTFQRVPLPYTRPVVTIGRAIALGALAIVLAASFVLAFRHRRAPLAKGRGWVVSRLGAGAILGAIVAWTVITGMLARDLAWRMSGAADPWLTACYGLSVLATAGVVAVGWRTVTAWRVAGWPFRTLDVIASLAALYWLWFAIAFGALSFDLSY